ncbi:MAG: TetR/AcrR family transcriptional regulator [Elusimicrobiaceae bacterium]|nr:TetR/AcrR family transcriptional regulator [Elusimicrobiaceae bacterium]
MPKKTKTREDKNVREQRMRARIKSAAFKLMAEKGIENVSMREIAEKVKVTKPVLYYYFKDKEDLCSSIIAQHTEHFSQFLQKALSTDLSAAELLGEIFERHLEFFQKDTRNSKFIAQVMSHALNTKLRRFSPKTQEEALNGALACLAEKGEIPQKGKMDLECLVRAVFLQIMLSAYIRQHASVQMPYEYDNSSVNRLAKILVLGIREYYKPR